MVIPIFNNARTLPELVERLRRVGPEKVLFVEDCGSDASREILREIADHQFGALFMRENVGQHRAFLSGIGQVRTRRAILMDGDLQDRPESLPLLQEKLGSADVVFAQRLGKASLGSNLLKGVFRLASKGRLPRNVGTHMALGPRALSFLQTVRCRRDPYLIGLLALSGLKLTAVPTLRDSSGSSSYNLGKRVMMGLRALRGSGLLPWLPVPPRPGRAEIAESCGWPE